MSDLIHSYESNKIAFAHFVARMDELINNMNNPPQQWLGDVKSLWEDLEEINAILLDESNENRTIDNFKNEIALTITRLTELIAEFPK